MDSAQAIHRRTVAARQVLRERQFVARGVDRDEAVVELGQQLAAFALRHKPLCLRQQLHASRLVALERPRLTVRDGRLQNARSKLLADGGWCGRHELYDVLASR